MESLSFSFWPSYACPFFQKIFALVAFESLLANGYPQGFHFNRFSGPVSGPIQRVEVPRHNRLNPHEAAAGSSFDYVVSTSAKQIRGDWSVLAWLLSLMQCFHFSCLSWGSVFLIEWTSLPTVTDQMVHCRGCHRRSWICPCRIVCPENKSTFRAGSANPDRSSLPKSISKSAHTFRAHAFGFTRKAWEKAT